MDKRICFLLLVFVLVVTLDGKPDQLWTIRLRAMQSPLPVGACTAIEIVPRDAKGLVPVRPDGMQISWQDFELTLVEGKEGFSWRGNNPRSAFICASTPGVTATVQVSYPGSHLSERQRINGITASQTLQLTSVPAQQPRSALPSAPAATTLQGRGTSGSLTPGAAPAPRNSPPSKQQAAQAAGPGANSPAGAMAPEDKVAFSMGDFSDIDSLIFGQQRYADAATIVLDSPVEVHRRTPDALSFTIQMPTKEIWKADLSIARNRRYMPTPADLRARAEGKTVFDVKIRHYLAGNTLTSKLEYFMVDGTTKKAASLDRPWMDRFWGGILNNIFPTVHAQGMEWAGSTATSVTSRVVQEGLKTWQSHRADFTQHTGIKTASGPTLQVALKTQEYAEIAQKFATIANETRMMAQTLRAKRKCVEKPTNPLTKREYERNPSEQKKAADALDSAENDVFYNSWVRNMNAIVGVIGGSAEIGSVAGGMALSEVFSQMESMSDAALKEASQRSVDEASRSIVACRGKMDQETAAVPLRPMAVTIAYQYNRETYGCTDATCGFVSLATEAKGNATIAPPYKSLSFNMLDGKGKVQWKSKETAKDSRDTRRCGTFISTYTRALSGEMSGDVEGNRVPGKFSRLKITMRGRGTIKGAEERTRMKNNDYIPKVECEVSVDKESIEIKDSDGIGFSCIFDYVDLIDGGSFATFSEGDHGYGTCTVELAPIN